MSPTFDTAVLSGAVLDLQTSTSCKSSKIVLLESLQTAASIHLADNLLWGGGVRWKTIEEIMGNESKTMVFKSLNGLALQYLCNLFTKNSACSSSNLLNTETDLRLPKKNSGNGQNAFLSGELNY